MKIKIFLYSLILIATSATISGFLSFGFVQGIFKVETTWYHIAIGIFAGLLFTLLLALWFSSVATRPINDFIKTSGEISMSNYPKHIDASSKDEIGQLAGIFNKMNEKLGNTLASLLEKNLEVDSIVNSMISGIIAVDVKYKVILINSIACDMFGIKYGPGVAGIDIFELIDNSLVNAFLMETVEKNISLVNEIIIGSPQEKVLRIYTAPIKSNDNRSINSGGIVSIHDITNIKKLGQIRTEFVSNVTHELKTPLTSIRGFVETLRSGALDDREIAEKFLDIIDIEAERLDTLIDDLLQLSEIEAKPKDTNMGNYNLKPVVEEVFSILHGAAIKKGIALKHEINKNITIFANKDRIKQMLINLVDNGIKYNIENGTVNIKAGKVKGKTIITVKDTGIGIAAENLPRIFERFYRVDKGRSRSVGGTGLGLSIVKHIVNLYGGDIKISSEPDKGTEFVIQLPSP